MRRFLLLPQTDRLLLIQAAILTVAIRLALLLFRFETLRRLLAGMARANGRARSVEPAPVDRVAWAIRAASRRMPWVATCLTKAMAAQFLLGRMGEASQLQVGVAKDSRGRVTAHAWLLNRGSVLVGGERGRSSFTFLPPLEAPEQ